MALLVTVLVYGVVGVSALLVAGPDLFAVSTSPLVDAAGAAGRPGIGRVVRLEASLGALLELMPGNPDGRRWR